MVKRFVVGGRVVGGERSGDGCQVERGFGLLCGELKLLQSATGLLLEREGGFA